MSTPNPPLGRLFLVPAPLDFGCASQAPLEAVLPSGTLQRAAQLTHWVCENAKSCRAYLKRIDALIPLSAPLQSHTIQELPRHEFYLTVKKSLQDKVNDVKIE